MSPERQYALIRPLIRTYQIRLPIRLPNDPILPPGVLPRPLESTPPLQLTKKEGKRAEEQEEEEKEEEEEDKEEEEDEDEDEEEDNTESEESEGFSSI
jgi:hypothetical protein